MRTKSPLPRLLVIDDEPMITRVIARTLARDYDVTPVTRGTDALTKLRAGERFDIILCDVIMPDVSGMDLHAELEVFAPDQSRCMFFLTGGAFTPAAQEFLSRVSTPVLEKPFDADALRRFLHECLSALRDGRQDHDLMAPFQSAKMQSVRRIESVPPVMSPSGHMPVGSTQGGRVIAADTTDADEDAPATKRG